MHWTGPSEEDALNGTLEKRLSGRADQFRASSGFTAAQCSRPLHGCERDTRQGGNDTSASGDAHDARTPFSA
jgi:hypothetical protein